MGKLKRPDNTKQWIIVGCGCVLVLACGAGAYFIFFGKPNPATMNAAQIQKFVQSEDFNSMPREQRREFFEQVMDSRVQGYFSTAPQERDKYLDKIIDDMQNFRPQRPPGDRGGFDPNRFQAMRNSITPEQRRLFRETRDPVKDALRREFFHAMRTRAEARGIQMGRFGGGGRGPGGGRN